MMKLDLKFVLIAIAAVAFVVHSFTKAKMGPPRIIHTVERVDPIPIASSDTNDYMMNMSANGLQEPQFPSHSWMDFNDPSIRVPEQELF